MGKLTAVVSILDKLYGGGFEVETNDVAVSSTGDKIVLGNMERVGLTIINYGANAVFLTNSRYPAYGTGIYLAGSGGYFSINVRDDFVLPAFKWYGITDTGLNTTLLVYEMLQYTLSSLGG